jgi:hypothetical protein
MSCLSPWKPLFVHLTYALLYSLSKHALELWWGHQPTVLERQVRHRNSMGSKVREPEKHLCSVLGHMTSLKILPSWTSSLWRVLPISFPLLSSRHLRITWAGMSIGIPPGTSQISLQTLLCVSPSLCYFCPTVLWFFISLSLKRHFIPAHKDCAVFIYAI